VLLTALVLIDATTLALAVSLAGLLRLVLDQVVPVANLGWGERHLVASVLLIPFLLVVFQIEGLYELDHILAGTREYARVAHSATYGLVVVLAASYLAGGSPLVSRSWLLLVWALSIGFVVVGRFLLRRAVRRIRRSGALRSRVVIVGASTLGIAIAEQVRTARDEGLDVIGFLDEYLPLGQPLLDGIEVIGRPRDLIRGSVPQLADEYILVPQAIPHERLEEITHLMVSRGGPALRMAVSPSGLLTNWVSVAERGGVPLVTLGRAQLEPLERTLKYALDLAVATLALVLLAPLAAAPAIRAYVLGRRPLLSTFPIHGAGGIKFTLQRRRGALASAPRRAGVPVCCLRSPESRGPAASALGGRWHGSAGAVANHYEAGPHRSMEAQRSRRFAQRSDGRGPHVCPQLQHLGGPPHTLGVDAPSARRSDRALARPVARPR
jgi:hypothetical protein